MRCYSFVHERWCSSCGENRVREFFIVSDTFDDLIDARCLFSDIQECLQHSPLTS